MTYISANLRDRDIVEFKASLGNLDIPGTIATIANASVPYSFVFWLDGVPVFMYGVLINPMVPHVAQAWGYGTSAAWKAIPAAGEHVNGHTLPELFKPGSPVNRLEVRVLAANKSSTQWLDRWLGARFETVLKDFGTQQEDFLQFAWLRSDFDV